MNPINRFIDTMFAEQERRHAWIIAAGEQIRRENERVSALPNKREPKSMGDCRSGTVATQASPRAGSRLGHSVSVNYRKEGDQ